MRLLSFFLLLVWRRCYLASWLDLDGEVSVDLCGDRSNGGVHCNWRLQRKGNMDWSRGSAGNCDSILIKGGNNQLLLNESLVSSISTGDSPDISYERLWLLPKGEFRSFVTLEPAGGVVSGQPKGAARVGAVNFPKMHPTSFAKYCKNVTSFRDEFSPGVLCQNGQNKHLMVASSDNLVERMPWCGAWNSSAVVGVLDCGISESFQSHQSTLYSIYQKHGIVSAKDADNHLSRFKCLRSFIIPPGAVDFLPELAVAGYAEGVAAPGHFHNEVLPRLLFLDSVLPRHIPMAWPGGDIPQEFKKVFEAAGLLTNRTFIVTKLRSPITQVAKRLYFVTSSTRQGDPLCLWSLHRLLHGMWMRVLDHEDKSAGAIKAKSSTFGRILASVQSTAQSQSQNQSQPVKFFVVQRPRGRSRSITNHRGLVDRLVAALPSVKVEEITFSEGSLMATARKLRSGKLFIAPHGAGLNNMFLLPHDATVVEIGYVGGADFPWPSDYLCLARNLGFRYYASLAESGGQGSDLTANIDEIVSIAKEVFAQIRHTV